MRTARPGRRLFVPKSVRQPAATLEKEFFHAEQTHPGPRFLGGAAHWGKVIVALSRKGHQSICAIENPLTSLADDAERTRKMIAQQKAPELLVGHSYGGAVITEAGDMPNVVGLVYIAAFAPDAGESPGGVTAKSPPVAVPNLAPDSDGYLWIKPDKFHESFCQDLTADEALVMAVTQKAPVASTFENPLTAPAWKKKPGCPAALAPGRSSR